MCDDVCVCEMFLVYLFYVEYQPCDVYDLMKEFIESVVLKIILILVPGKKSYCNSHVEMPVEKSCHQECARFSSCNRLSLRNRLSTLRCGAALNEFKMTGH